MLTGLGFMLSLMCHAQLPLLKEKSWIVTAGGITSFPVAPPYFDHSVTTGADFFWEYHVVPRPSTGFMAGLSKAGMLDIEKGFGYFELGCNVQALSVRLDYNGWSGGGFTGLIYHGKGTRSWTDYKFVFSSKIAHLVMLGKKNREVVNGLSLCLELNVLELEHFVFSGEESSAGGSRPYESVTRTYRWIGSGTGIPDLKLYYEFGYLIRTSRGAIIPGFRTSFLNFSNFIPQPFPPQEALRKRDEYFKDVTFVLSWIPRAKK